MHLVWNPSWLVLIHSKDIFTSVLRLSAYVILYLHLIFYLKNRVWNLLFNKVPGERQIGHILCKDTSCVLWTGKLTESQIFSSSKPNLNLSKKTLNQLVWLRRTLKSKSPPHKTFTQNLHPKLLNINKTAYKSPILTNDIFLELSGQDL